MKLGRALFHRLLSFTRRLSGFYRLRQELKMIHADVQAQLDRTTALTASIPGIVQTAVSNAEAAKDSDHQDDAAALTAENDKLQAQLDAITAQYAAATTTEPAAEPEA